MKLETFSNNPLLKLTQTDNTKLPGIEQDDLLFEQHTTLVLKVLYYEKHVFSGLYIYKLVLHEPANSQNEESKQVVHGLCSPPTGKTALLQAVQIQLLSLTKRVISISRPPLRDDRRYPGGAFIPEVKFGVSSGKIAVYF